MRKADPSPVLLPCTFPQKLGIHTLGEQENISLLTGPAKPQSSDLLWWHFFLPTTKIMWWCDYAWGKKHASLFTTDKRSDLKWPTDIKWKIQSKYTKQFWVNTNDNFVHDKRDPRYEFHNALCALITKVALSKGVLCTESIALDLLLIHNTPLTSFWSEHTLKQKKWYDGQWERHAN